MSRSLLRSVAHVIGERAERGEQHRAHVGLGDLLVDGASHAQEPLVALALADGERQMARAQPRMTEALDVHGRPAEPADEEPAQLVARALERGRMKRADLARLGQGVHEIIEAIDERADAGLTADALV